MEFGQIAYLLKKKNLIAHPGQIENKIKLVQFQLILIWFNLLNTPYVWEFLKKVDGIEKGFVLV